MFASWFRLLSRSKRPAVHWKTRHHVTPTLEALEERWLPSTTGSLQSLLGTGYNSLNANATTTTNSTAVQTQQVSAAFTPFTTGASQTQSVAQFNPALGTLDSVQIILNGTLTSDVKVENLDAAPATVNAQVNGNLSLQGPGGTLLSVTPSITDNSTQLSAYDGVLDYGGSSGHDFGEQSASAQQTITLTNNLSAWEGNGNVSLTETAQSSSTVSGSGNEQVHISSQGSGTVTVIYTYTPAPPPAPPPVPPASPPPSPPPCTCDCDCDCNTTPTGPAAINGIVYVAPNQTAPYALGDPGVSNVTVTLTGVTLTQQQVSETATTDANGHYSFTNLQPGIYAVTDQPIPAGYTAGAVTAGNYGGVVSGNQILLALPEGGDAMSYDFGLVIPSGPNINPLTPPPSPSPSPAPSPPPSPAPPPQTQTDPPPVLSKRELLGDGWQSLG
jgi:hypothetical protein